MLFSLFALLDYHIHQTNKQFAFFFFYFAFAKATDDAYDHATTDHDQQQAGANQDQRDQLIAIVKREEARQRQYGIRWRTNEIQIIE